MSTIDEIVSRTLRLNFERGFSTRGTIGFGLSIMQQDVEQLRGRVYFTSKIGEGTTFYVEIPK